MTRSASLLLITVCCFVASAQQPVPPANAVQPEILMKRLKLPKLQIGRPVVTARRNSLCAVPLLNVAPLDSVVPMPSARIATGDKMPEAALPAPSCADLPR